MASTIVTKNSSTASAVPLTGDLTQGELAVNVTDKKLYTKDSGGTVVKLVGGLGNQEANAVAITGGSINGTTIGATTASTGAFTTLSASGTTTLSGGTANGVAYLNGSKVLTTGSALTFVGGALLNTGSFAPTDGTNIGEIKINSATLDFNTSSSAVPQVFRLGSSEQMRLTSTGLGIGTSSPARKLQVNSSEAVAARFTRNGGIVANNSLEWFDGTNGWYAGVSGSNFWGVAYNSSGGIDSAAIRLDSSGNLGLGVTPSAWSGQKALEFSYGALSAGTGLGTLLASNAYYNGTNWIYRITTASSYYLQDSNGHKWFYAPSGTAGNPITFTQAMTLDASGQLGIGATSPTATLHVTTGNATVGLFATSRASGGYIQYSLGASGTSIGYMGSAGQISTTGGTNDFSLRAENNLLFNAGGNVERARIDSSGNLLVGETSAWPGTSPRIEVKGNGSQHVFSSWNSAANNAGVAGILGRVDNPTGNYLALWYYQGSTAIGSITATTTSTAYNTSSDYRLKDIIGPLTGSGEFIDALQPKVGTWKADGSKFVGFLAHEVQEVSPGSVVGEKDAVDEEGKPIMQAMEYGSAEFIANIVAELQSLRKRVAQLEGK